MKLNRLIAVLLAAFFLLAAQGFAEPLPVPPEAETGQSEGQAAPSGTQIQALPRVDFDEAGAGFEGTWVTFEDGFRLYLPGEWVYYEISDEESEAGIFYRAGNEGSDGIVGEIPMGMAVSYVSAGDLQTLDDLIRDFEAAGMTGMNAQDLNGVPAVAFEKPEDGYRGVSFYHPVYTGYVMSVYVTPIGEPDSAVRAVGDAILNSLSPWSEPFEE